MAGVLKVHSFAVLLYNGGLEGHRLRPPTDGQSWTEDPALSAPCLGFRFRNEGGTTLPRGPDVQKGAVFKEEADSAFLAHTSPDYCSHSQHRHMCTWASLAGICLDGQPQWPKTKGQGLIDQGLPVPT